MTHRIWTVGRTSLRGRAAGVTSPPHGHSSLVSDIAKSSAPMCMRARRTALSIDIGDKSRRTRRVIAVGGIGIGKDLFLVAHPRKLCCDASECDYK